MPRVSQWLAVALFCALLATNVQRLHWWLYRAGLAYRPGIDATLAIDAQRHLDGSVRAGSLILVGDSVLARAPWRDGCLANFAISGTRSDQIRLPEAINRAFAAVIATGTNDLRQGRVKGLSQRVSALLSRIRVPAYLLAIPGHLPGADEANAVLRNACRKGCTFIPPVAVGADGIHPSLEGYRKVRAMIRGQCH